MGAIRVLSEVIANKIAAGEVIERTASVAKELMENSLDAGATFLELALEHGGKSLIRVSDNGCGMDPEDARLAFERHATSKIATVQDLDGIGSFGFRGEALPSIAAVSRTRLITRALRALTGTEVVVEGGNRLGVQVHPCAPGTIVEVRDLFFNTPARRKFLKADSTELGRALEWVHRLALSAPQVRFTVKSSGQSILDLLAVTDLKARVQMILGEKGEQTLLPLKAERDGIRLTGFIGKPSISRSNRSGMLFYVNGRWVRSPSFSYAVQAGTQDGLAHGRFPVAVLFLEVDRSRVDVNVHPTKQEVRISNEPEVTALIRQTVRECLRKGQDLSDRLLVPPIPSGWPAMAVKPYSLGAPLEAIYEAPTTIFEPIAIKNSLAVTKVLGQVHQTFLIAETEDGFMVIDQHAAHERIVYERLLESLKSGRAERQRLFLEEVLELGIRQREIFERALELLSGVGFEIEPFGERTFIVRAIPAAFGEQNATDLIKRFLEELEEGKLDTVLEDQSRALAALLACKRESVKAHDPLHPTAIRALLESLSQCENPFHCPHGRPVFFTTSISDLEKQFKRG